MSDDDLEVNRALILEMDADYIGTSIEHAEQGSESAYREVLELYRQALEDDITPDERIMAFVLHTLEDKRVVRALYPRKKPGGQPSDEIAGRDLQFARSVVRVQRLTEGRWRKN